MSKIVGCTTRPKCGNLIFSKLHYFSKDLKISIWVDLDALAFYISFLSLKTTLQVLFVAKYHLMLSIIYKWS